jgi:hypothetical protein
MMLPFKVSQIICAKAALLCCQKMLVKLTTSVGVIVILCLSIVAPQKQAIVLPLKAKPSI